MCKLVVVLFFEPNPTDITSKIFRQHSHRITDQGSDDHVGYRKTCCHLLVKLCLTLLFGGHASGTVNTRNFKDHKLETPRPQRVGGAEPAVLT